MGALILLALYCAPMIVAIVRKHPSVGSIAVINLLLGWTIVGWIVALAMSAGATEKRVIQIGKSQPSIVIENIVGDHNSISRRETMTASTGTSTRPELTSSQRCSQGHAVALGTRFCPDCGVAVGKTCANGHVVADSVKFCGECGAAAGALPSGTL